MKQMQVAPSEIILVMDLMLGSVVPLALILLPITFNCEREKYCKAGREIVQVAEKPLIQN